MSLTRFVKDAVKSTKIYKWYRGKRTWTCSPEYLEAEEMINASTNMIDLGCGTSPHPKARVAVDKYIKPVHRKYGANKTIDVIAIEKQGIQFVQADFENLPFQDNQFDLAYSHHVVEHLDNPAAACREMQRISGGG